MGQVNFNGKIFPDSTPLFTAGHHGLRYGDGLFETMRCQAGKLPLLPVHLERLFAGMQALGMERPPYFNTTFFEEEIKKILPAAGTVRVRLLLTRKEGGADFLIEAYPVKISPPTIPESGILNGIRIAPSALTPFKTANRLPYVIATQARRALRWEEGVLLNQEGRVADGCHSNIFARIEGVWRTPSVAEGALAGVMRSWIIHAMGDSLIAGPLRAEDLEKADEIWFSNALQGIRRVENFENRALGDTSWREFFASSDELWKKGAPASCHWVNF